MTETGRFYSSIRRIPTTLYRLPDGTRVPGGPYTLVQGVGGAITVALLWAVRGSWTTGFDLLDFAGALAAGLAVTWLLRFAPDNLHELGLVITGAFLAWSKPPHGHYRGETFAPKKAPVGMPEKPSSPTAPTRAPATDEPQGEPAPTYRPMGTSSVARLLQQSTTENKDTQR